MICILSSKKFFVLNFVISFFTVSDGKMRKSFRNFVISRISESLKNREFLDVGLIGGDANTSCEETLTGHRFVLAGLSPLLAEVLRTVPNFEETVSISLPDFSSETINVFLNLAYGHSDPAR